MYDWLLPIYTKYVLAQHGVIYHSQKPNTSHKLEVLVIKLSKKKSFRSYFTGQRSGKEALYNP